MLVSKFSTASVTAFLVAPYALAQTETRLPEVGVSAPRAGAQGYTPPVTSTGAKTAAPLRAPAAPGMVVPKEMPRAQSALPLDDAINYASGPSLFDMSPLPPCAPRFLPILKGVDHAIRNPLRFDC